METKYFVSDDGNRHGLFDSLELAEHYILKKNGWTDSEIAEKWAFVKKKPENTAETRFLLMAVIRCGLSTN
ncbi:hypothetical protein [Neisseria weixii]|uniref:hypothetical protein n=1 Tax=Neisseria weixii TaxID=1853276 RepID=UPI000BB71263|nr:hypothetical protein [Neisseria weixii]ATD64632.1 hypothetical protein CGZ65_03620 [Neisseria weixii]